MYLFAALALAVIPAPLGSLFGPIIHEPTVNLSAVRPISCDEGSGTGFLIANNTLVTALHVATLGNCKDAETRVPLLTYHEDKEHDFAIMTGNYPTVSSYIKYSCQPYETGKTYMSVGYRRMYRMDKLMATDYYSPKGFMVSGADMGGMRKLKGGIVGGMSGGLVFDQDTGKGHGINNVNSWDRDGHIDYSYSYEFKDTILCK